MKPYYHDGADDADDENEHDDDRERNDDMVRFARSLCVRKRLIARWLPDMPLPQF